MIVGKLNEDEHHNFGHLADLEEVATHLRQHIINNAVVRLGLDQGMYRFILEDDGVYLDKMENEDSEH